MLFDIGEQIPESRKMRHVSQAEVAHALGMGRTNIGQIENGTVQENGGGRKLIRILEFFNLELCVRSAGKPPTLDELRKEGC